MCANKCITLVVCFNNYDIKYRAEFENYNMFSEAEKEYFTHRGRYVSSYYGKGTLMIFFFFACNYSAVYSGNLCFLQRYLTKPFSKMAWNVQHLGEFVIVKIN